MALPTPELGLVIHYGFVWAGAGRKAPVDAGKERPCLIVDIEADATPWRVTYLPISHVAPGPDEIAVTIPPGVARHLGLTSQRSYLYVSYAVEDDWPYDLAHVPGAPSRFDYGFVPSALFAEVAKRFAAYQTASPASTYRR